MGILGAKSSSCSKSIKRDDVPLAKMNYETSNSHTTRAAREGRALLVSASR